MKAYYDAVWEYDPSMHHEYVLLGNMYIALVEQFPGLSHVHKNHFSWLCLPPQVSFA